MNSLLLAVQEHGEEVVHHAEDGFLTNYMWLVPLLPAVAFLVILFFGKRLPGQGHSVGIASIDMTPESFAAEFSVPIRVVLQKVRGH